MGPKLPAWFLEQEEKDKLAAQEYAHDDDDDDMEEIFVDIEAARNVKNNIKVDGVLAEQNSFVCQSGYESLFVWMILQLIEKHNLQWSSVIELLYIVLMCNNALTFYFISLNWLYHYPVLDGESFVMWYYRDCANRGFVPGARNNPHFSTTANIWPGIFSK